MVGCFSLLPRIGVPPGCVRMKADGRLKRRGVSAEKRMRERESDRKRERERERESKKRYRERKQKDRGI